jgi:hypothetical protein
VVGPPPLVDELAPPAVAVLPVVDAAPPVPVVPLPVVVLEPAIPPEPTAPPMPIPTTSSAPASDIKVNEMTRVLQPASSMARRHARRSSPEIIADSCHREACRATATFHTLAREASKAARINERRLSRRPCFDRQEEVTRASAARAAAGVGLLNLDWIHVGSVEAVRQGVTAKQ